MKNITDFLIKNQDKIVNLVAFILVFVIAFLIGRLSIGERVREISVSRLDIIKSEVINSVGETVRNDSGNAVNNAEKGQFVGSRNSDKYHPLDCSWAKRIKPENRIWFQSKEEAEKMGYSPSSCVK
tara:strand:- start:42 stop:419 length:378 start_codon:yes stop_codon:yes gene_type:complete